MVEMQPVYIERQKNYTKQIGTFGPTGSIGGCGCGAIALYNVLNHFGIRTDFISIVNRFNRVWPFATTCGGCLGTNIFYLYHILRRYGFSVRPVLFTKKQIQKFRLDHRSAFILLYYWKKKNKIGGHYQAGFANLDGSITIHNSKSTHQDIRALLQEKRKRENMWLCLGLMIQK